MEFKVIRSDRKTIAISIRGDKIIIKAPVQATNEDINSFMLDHKKWIESHVAEAQAKKAVTDTIQRLSEDQVKALEEKAIIVLTERVEHFAPLIGVTYGKIGINCQKSDWGRCYSNGNLCFNCMLMLAPPEAIDSVVIHELCHRKEMNHSDRFYAEVLKYFPDYWKWDKWLKDYCNLFMARLPK